MMMRKMCGVHKVAWVLLIIGGLNWGLAALGYNVVDMIFGMGSMLSKVIYLLVGISAIAMLGIGKCCMKGEGGCMCHGGNCDHCGTGEMKKDMPMGGMDKKM